MVLVSFYTTLKMIQDGQLSVDDELLEVGDESLDGMHYDKVHF